MRNRSNASLPAVYASSRSGWHRHGAQPGPLEVFELNYLHYHDTLELGLCLSGQGVCRIEDTETPFAAGDVQIIFPFQRHLSKSTGGETSRWYWLNLDPEALISCWNPGAAPAVEELLHRQMGLYGILKPSEYPYLAEMITRIIRVDAAADPLPEHRADYLASSLYLLLLELYRVSLPLPKLTLRPGRRFSALRPALNAIDAALSSGEDCSVAGLAQLCGMSEASFRRNFHAGVGQSPGDYIAFCRLRRAQNQLVFTNRSVLEIALSVGFGDPSGLYRCFRSRCGLSPQEYRRMFRA